MLNTPGSVLERLANEAVRLGADSLEVEYKHGFEEVIAMTGRLGVGIARLPSSGPEAGRLRAELLRAVHRTRHVVVDGIQYKLRSSVYDSFGEDAFHVELRRV